ncbi:MAG: hypothetical protein V8Q28_04955 [Alistipes sp.]
MNKLICHVGLLCGVLLGMLDATSAQSFAVQRVGCGKQAVILISGICLFGRRMAADRRRPARGLHLLCWYHARLCRGRRGDGIPLLTTRRGRLLILSGMSGSKSPC